MKKLHVVLFTAITFTLGACGNAENKTTNTEASNATATVGQSGVQDDASQKNVVQVAVSSKDHTTLVTAVKAVELVDALSNAGPFTVFAPTNEAFSKLDKATLNALMTDEKKADLQNILQYHVTVSAMKAESFQNGQTLGMVNGDNVTISIKDGKVVLNNTATIIASIPASNGIIHVIDAVLLPPTKK